MIATTASSSLIYGASRTYKSTQLALIAEYIYETTGRRCRMLSTETSSAAVFEPYIEAGIIEPLWLRRELHPRTVLRKVLLGEWPKVVGGKVQFVKTTEEEWKKIGAHFFEGLTTFAELIMIDLVSTGRKINEDIVGMYTEGDDLGGAIIKLGAAAKSHYGAVQQDILTLIKDAPNALFAVSGQNVQQIWYTAHESKGLDEQKVETVYGPATVGKAITDKIQKEIGLLVHTQEVIDKQTGKKKVLAFYRSHPDPENPNIIWQAGPRNVPDPEVDKVLASKFGPTGAIELSLDPPMGLVQFLKAHAELSKLALDRIRGRLKLQPPPPTAPVVGPTGTGQKPVTTN